MIILWCKYSSTRSESNPEQDTTVHVSRDHEYTDLILHDYSEKVSGYDMHIKACRGMLLI